MIIDSHCHLHDPAFADVPETLRVALAHDVWGVVGVGCDPETNLAHPGRGRGGAEGDLGVPRLPSRLDGSSPRRTSSRSRSRCASTTGASSGSARWGCRGTRSTGASDPASLMTRGRARLDRLLALAARYDLPVALHAPHGAAVGALEALKRHRIERAVFHWHKAPAEVTRQIVDAGYFVSVTPEVVYRERDRELVLQVPLGSLLVESDAPWKYGGEFATLSSGPWLAARVAEEVAKLKQLPVDDTMLELTSNTCRLFDLAWR